MTHRIVTLGVGIVSLVTMTFAQAPPARDWPAYGGDAEGRRYSPLTQITRANVARLQVAWQFDPRDAPGGGRGGMQVSPIVVGGVIFSETPGGNLVALNGATGALKWAWNSNSNGFRCR